MSWSPIRALSALALGCVLIAPPASAGNRHSFFLGHDAALTGGAVTAYTRTAEALWYNPAGLGANDRDELELSGNAIGLRLRRQPGAVRLLTPEEEYQGDSGSTFFINLAPALIIVRELTDHISAGAALLVNEHDVAGAVIQLGDETSAKEGTGSFVNANIAYERTRQYLGAAVGWQPQEWFRLGAGLFFLYETQSTTTTQSLTIAGATGEGGAVGWEGETVTGFASLFQGALQETTYGIGLTLGLQLELTDRLYVGVQLRSPTRLLGGDRVSQALELDGVSYADDTGSVEAISEGIEESIDIGERAWVEPAVLTAGVSLKWPRQGWVGAEVEGMSGLPADGDFPGRKRQWNARAGGIMFLGSSWAMGAGLFTDRSEERATAFPESDIDFYGVSGGFQVRRKVGLDDGEVAESLYFSTTVAVRYAWGFGTGYRITYDARDATKAADGLSLDEEQITYRANEVTLYLGSRLRF